MINKLKSNKGIFLSLIAYPILILAVAYAASAFVSSINGNNLAKINLTSMQAQYNALKGIEYAALEIKNQGPTFMTHTVNVNTDDTLDNVTTAPTPHYGGVINTSGAYALPLGGNNSVEVKTYLVNGEIFVLARGTSGNKQRLFAHKIAGTSLYNYFSFFPGDAGMGWQTLDAQGSKIHANGNIIFYEGERILNAKELSSEGKMYWQYQPFVQSGDETANYWLRFPFWTPNDYQYSASMPSDNATGNYVNEPDGHYDGDRYGLIAYSGAATPATPYRMWTNTGPGHPAETLPPIYPWPNDGSGWENLKDASNNPLWDPNSASRSFVYKQSDYLCGTGGSHPACVSADGLTNNASYIANNLYVNGYYIPNDLGGAFYQVPKYMGHNSGTDPQVNINLTDSDRTSQSRAAWDNFISAFPETDVNSNTITGLAGVVKAGLTRGANHIAPPNVDITALKNQAVNTGQGMAIESDPAGDPSNPIKITINGGDSQNGQTIRLPETDGASVNCGNDSTKPVFTQKTFTNGQSGKTNKVVKINVANMLACESAQPGKWVPNNGILYSTYSHGIVLDKAEQLPVGGLTSVIRGNVYLQGNYNYNASGATGWTWQPSAAIVSNFSYVLSKDFNYPTTLPYTYHHAEYPFAGTYTYAGNSYTIPAGTNNRDFTPGFNWWAVHKNDMEHRVDCPDCAGESQGAVDAYNVTGDHTLSYVYDISLVGKYGYGAGYLELWGYPSVDGDSGTAPSGWRGARAVVIGASVQLSTEFDPSVVGAQQVDWTNTRPCSNSGLTFPSGYPCRNNVGSAWDLINPNGSPLRKYQPQYLANVIRPPGDYTGYYKSILVELTNTSDNWIKHTGVRRRKRAPAVRTGSSPFAR